MLRDAYIVKCAGGGLPPFQPSHTKCAIPGAVLEAHHLSQSEGLLLSTNILSVC